MIIKGLKLQKRLDRMEFKSYNLEEEEEESNMRGEKEVFVGQSFKSCRNVSDVHKGLLTLMIYVTRVLNPNIQSQITSLYCSIQ